MALEITDANFEELVLKSDKPVLVDFWAAWCGPCRMLGPVIEEISSEYSDKATIGKVDIDSNQEYAAKYGVRNIPTVLLFQKGEVVTIYKKTQSLVLRQIRYHSSIFKYQIFVMGRQSPSTNCLIISNLSCNS